MKSASHNINDYFPRRRVFGFEGGAVYATERDGKFLAIIDQGTMFYMLDEKDRAGFEPLAILEFETAAERETYFESKCGWMRRIVH